MLGVEPEEKSTISSRSSIIPRTSAGTQGIVAASQAKPLFAASLVTAEANIRAFLSGSTRSGLPVNSRRSD
jgi:hypothetical protein